MPTKSATPLYTVLSCEGNVVDMASSDAEGALPTRIGNTKIRPKAHIPNKIK